MARQLRRRRGDLRGREPGRQDRRGPRPPPRAAHVAVDRSRPASPATSSPSRTSRPAARARDEGELRERSDAVGPDDPFTFIYTSGTTGPPKGCVLTHGNYRGVLDMCLRAERHPRRRDDLPLPAAGPLLRAARSSSASFDARRRDRLLRRRHAADHPRADRGQAVVLPVGPADLREALHAGHEHGRRPRADRAAAVEVGMAYRLKEVAGQEIPEDLAAAFAQADEALFSKVRAAFGGNVRQATSGAAPIAREILEFFYACGVPVLEGYGMTETSTVATYSTVENHQLRHRRARDPGLRGQDRRRRRGPDPRPPHLRGLLQGRREVVRRDRGRLAAHRRPRLARRGRLPVDHRPQEGHHHHRRREEPDARPTSRTTSSSRAGSPRP